MVSIILLTITCKCILAPMPNIPSSRPQWQTTQQSRPRTPRSAQLPAAEATIPSAIVASRRRSSIMIKREYNIVEHNAGQDLRIDTQSHSVEPQRRLHRYFFWNHYYVHEIPDFTLPCESSVKRPNFSILSLPSIRSSNPTSSWEIAQRRYAST